MINENDIPLGAKLNNLSQKDLLRHDLFQEITSNKTENPEASVQQFKINVDGSISEDIKSQLEQITKKENYGIVVYVLGHQDEKQKDRGTVYGGIWEMAMHRFAPSAEWMFDQVIRNTKQNYRDLFFSDMVVAQIAIPTLQKMKEPYWPKDDVLIK